MQSRNNLNEETFKLFDPTVKKSLYFFKNKNILL
jgi:hypothetical protein